MSRKKNHNFKLFSWSREYAEANGLVFHEYSEYHMRIIQDELCVLDIWTSGKYYFKDTNYNLYEAHIVERAGETGEFNPDNKKQFETILNKAFFPIDFA